MTVQMGKKMRVLKYHFTKKKGIDFISSGLHHEFKRESILFTKVSYLFQIETNLAKQESN